MPSKRYRLLLPLLIGSLLSIGCRARSTRVLVPTPVLLVKPPCILVDDRPPVPPEGSGPSDAAWAAYYQRIVGWSWRVWRACGEQPRTP